MSIGGCLAVFLSIGCLQSRQSHKIILALEINLKQRKLKLTSACRFLLALACILSVPDFVQTGHAFGLGKAIVESRLGQPLRVQIPVLLAEAETLDDVDIQLATRHDYEQMQLTPPRSLGLLHLDVKPDEQGITYVYLSTVEPMEEPVFSVLLSTKISHGTHFKLFQLLLDPGNMLARQPHPVLPKEEPVVAPKKAPSSSVAPHVKEGWARIWRYGPVRSGDSLSVIAYRLRKDKRYSNKVVTLALYDSNTQAFIDGNINRLKSHVYLDVPGKEMIEKYSPGDIDRRLAELLSKSGKASAKKHVKRPVKPTFRGAIRLDDSIHEGTESRKGAQQSTISAGDEAQTKTGALHTVLPEIEAMRNALKQSGKQARALEAHVATLQKEVSKLKIQLIAMRKARHTKENSGAGWGAILAFLLLISLISAGLLWYRNRQARSLPRANKTNDEFFDEAVAAAEAPKASEHVREAATEPSSEQETQVEEDETLDAAQLSTAAEAGDSSAGETTTAGDVETVPGSIQDGSTEENEEAEKGAIEIPQSREEGIRSLELYLRYGLCDEAEALLKTLSKECPDDLHIQALHAQLLNETGRTDECHEIIKSMRGQLDEDKWDEFCAALSPDLCSVLKQEEEHASEASDQDAADAEAPADKIEIESTSASTELEESLEVEENVEGEEKSADEIEFNLGDWQGMVENLDTNDSEDKKDEAAPVAEDVSTDTDISLEDFSDLNLDSIDIGSVETAENAEQEEKSARPQGKKRGRKSPD